MIQAIVEALEHAVYKLGYKELLSLLEVAVQKFSPSWQWEVTMLLSAVCCI